MADPIHVIIRRRKAASWARDIIYGYTPRPFPEKARMAWAMLAAHYCGKGFMRYGEFIAVAENMANTGMPEAKVGQRWYDENWDSGVRQAFAGALEAQAKRIAKMTNGERAAQFKAQLEKGKELQWAREAALTGRCPLCGSKDPDNCGDGIGRLKIDGKGGFIPPEPGMEARPYGEA